MSENFIFSWPIRLIDCVPFIYNSSFDKISMNEFDFFKTPKIIEYGLKNSFPLKGINILYIDIIKTYYITKVENYQRFVYFIIF